MQFLTDACIIVDDAHLLVSFKKKNYNNIAKIHCFEQEIKALQVNNPLRMHNSVQNSQQIYSSNNLYAKNNLVANTS